MLCVFLCHSTCVEVGRQIVGLSSIPVLQATEIGGIDFSYLLTEAIFSFSCMLFGLSHQYLNFSLYRFLFLWLNVFVYILLIIYYSGKLVFKVSFQYFSLCVYRYTTGLCSLRFYWKNFVLVLRVLLQPLGLLTIQDYLALNKLKPNLQK